MMNLKTVSAAIRSSPSGAITLGLETRRLWKMKLMILKKKNRPWKNHQTRKGPPLPCLLPCANGRLNQYLYSLFETFPDKILLGDFCPIFAGVMYHSQKQTFGTRIKPRA